MLKIQTSFRTEKERNKLFTLKHKVLWKTKFSYNFINELPSGKLQMNYLLNRPEAFVIEDFRNVFQYYKFINT